MINTLFADRSERKSEPSLVKLSAFTLLILGFCASLLGVASETDEMSSPPSAPITLPLSSDFVWRLTNAIGQLWLIGDLNFGRDAQLAWSLGVEQALQECDVLAVETDPLRRDAEELVELTREHGMLPQGENLFSFLDTATRQRLQEWLARKHYPATLFGYQRPWLAALTLLGLERQRLGYLENASLTHRLLTKIGDAHPIIELETHRQQIQRLARLALVDQVTLLTQTLDLLPHLTDHLNSVERAWEAGDAQQVARLLNSTLDEEPALQRALMTERQERVMAAVETLVDNALVPCVVIGAAQTAGLLERLQQQGYVLSPKPVVADVLP